MRLADCELAALIPRSVAGMSIDHKIAQTLALAIWAEADVDQKRHRGLSYIRRHGIGHVHINRGGLASVRTATALLQHAAIEGSGIPTTFGADLEQGAPHSFAYGTELPWQQAIGATNEPDHARRAGLIAGREAGALGVHVLYGPCADVLTEPENTLLASRAFSTRADLAAICTAAFVQGALTAGVTPCVKHLPGHGGAVADSHIALPFDPASADELAQTHLAPFRAALAAGADMMMTGHVVFPAIDPEAPATLSRPILTEIVRHGMGFDGVIITDSLNMHAIKSCQPHPRRESALRALLAGADLLLHPGSPQAAHDYLRTAVDDGRLPMAILDAAVERVLAGKRRALARSLVQPAADDQAEEHARWAEAIARTGLLWLRGGSAAGWLKPGGSLQVLTFIDDDGLDLAWDDAFSPALRSRGLVVQSETARGHLDEPTTARWRAIAAATAPGRLILAIWCPMRWYKGRARLAPETVTQLGQILAANPSNLLVLGGPAIIAAQLAAPNAVCVYGPSASSQCAVAAALC